MYYFSVKQTLHYPEFVEWCVNNYSPTERLIMNKNTTRILCQVNENVIHKVLNVPKIFPENTKALREETLVQVYRECMYEIKNSFLTGILKVGNVVESLAFSMDVHLFQEEAQLVLLILSQILGYDDDKSVTEVMPLVLIRILGAKTRKAWMPREEEIKAENLLTFDA